MICLQKRNGSMAQQREGCGCRCLMGGISWSGRRRGCGSLGYQRRKSLNRSLYGLVGRLRPDLALKINNTKVDLARRVLGLRQVRVAPTPLFSPRMASQNGPQVQKVPDVDGSYINSLGSAGKSNAVPSIMIETFLFTKMK